MTLDELSREYEHSAQLLRDRLKELRQLLKQTEDPEERWQINRRIQDLAPMLTECNRLAELTQNYYERGYYRDERYSSNGIRGGKQERHSSRYPSANNDKRTDGNPAGYGHSMLFEGHVNRTVCKSSWRKQIHRQQRSKTSAGENQKIHQIHPHFSASDFGRLMGAIWDETDRKEE